MFSAIYLTVWTWVPNLVLSELAFAFLLTSNTRVPGTFCNSLFKKVVSRLPVLYQPMSVCAALEMRMLLESVSILIFFHCGPHKCPVCMMWVKSEMVIARTWGSMGPMSIAPRRQSHTMLPQSQAKQLSPEAQQVLTFILQRKLITGTCVHTELSTIFSHKGEKVICLILCCLFIKSPGD